MLADSEGGVSCWILVYVVWRVLRVGVRLVFCGWFGGLALSFGFCGVVGWVSMFC